MKSPMARISDSPVCLILGRIRSFPYPTHPAMRLSLPTNVPIQGWPGPARERLAPADLTAASAPLEQLADNWYPFHIKRFD